MATKKKSKLLSTKAKFNPIQVLAVVVILVAAGVAFVLFTHASTGKCINSTFKQGSSGNCVKDIQYMLNGLNAPTNKTPQLKVDGSYGSATSLTVGALQVTYQKQKWSDGSLVNPGLKVDGIVGPQTWLLMCNSYSPLKSYENRSYPLVYQQAIFAAASAGCTIK